MTHTHLTVCSLKTLVFHVLYHTGAPVLLGAPTGSGKTIVAELTLLVSDERIFHPLDF